MKNKVKKRKKIHKKNKLQWLLIFILSVFLAMLISVFILNRIFKNEHVSLMSLETNQWEKAKNWLSQHKSALHPILQNKNKLIKAEEETPLHFEFYTALPNSHNVLPLNKNESSRHLQNPMIDHVKPEIKKAVISSDDLFKALEVEKPLQKKNAQTACVIEMGPYSRHHQAEKMSERLKKIGFTAMIKPIYVNKQSVYILQIGPYVEEEQIKSTQYALQKAGFSSNVTPLK